MSTDDLIGMLAQQAGPAEPAGDGRVLAIGLAMALPVMLAATALVLGFIPSTLWVASSTGPKLLYALALAGSGLWLMRRIGHPGSGITGPAVALALVLSMFFVMGAVDLMQVPPEGRMMEMMGKSSTRCPLAILILSLPALAVALTAVRTLAPTDLRRAGLGAGLLAGGLGAAAYAFACDEGAMSFIALWYTLGMVLTGFLGAVLGPRVLRW